MFHPFAPSTFFEETNLKWGSIDFECCHNTFYFSRSIRSFIIIFWYFRRLPIQLKNVKRHNNAVKFKTTTTNEWKISRITAHQHFIVFVRVQSLVGYRGVLLFHRSSIALMQTVWGVIPSVHQFHCAWCWVWTTKGISRRVLFVILMRIKSSGRVSLQMPIDYY